VAAPRISAPPRPRWISRYFGHILPNLRRRGRSSALAGSLYNLAGGVIDRAERSAPSTALGIYRSVSARQAYELGLPVYLFTNPRAILGDTGTNAIVPPVPQSGRVSVPGFDRYFGRVRPLFSATEAA